MRNDRCADCGVLLSTEHTIVVTPKETYRFCGPKCVAAYFSVQLMSSSGQATVGLRDGESAYTFTLRRASS